MTALNIEEIGIMSIKLSVHFNFGDEWDYMIDF